MREPDFNLPIFMTCQVRALQSEVRRLLLTSEDQAGFLPRPRLPPALPALDWPGSAGEILLSLAGGEAERGQQVLAHLGVEGEGGDGAGVEGEKVGREVLRPAGTDQVQEDDLLLTQDDQAVRLPVSLRLGLRHDEVNNLGAEFKHHVVFL